MGAESENRTCRVGEVDETGAPDAISQGGKPGEVWGCETLDAEFGLKGLSVPPGDAFFYLPLLEDPLQECCFFVH